jgi:hypothetical protein
MIIMMRIRMPFTKRPFRHARFSLVFKAISQIPLKSEQGSNILIASKDQPVIKLDISLLSRLLSVRQEKPGKLYGSFS